MSTLTRERGEYFFIFVAGFRLGFSFPGDGRVEGVGEAVFEQAEEIWIANRFLHAQDGVFDLGEVESATCWDWSLVW